METTSKYNRHTNPFAVCSLQFSKSIGKNKILTVFSACLSLYRSTPITSQL